MESVETLRSQARAPLRTRLLCVLLLCGAVLAHALPRWQGPVDLRFDGATYYVLGASLASGQGYRLLNEPGEIEAVQYPPLFPAWIAAHMRLAGSTDPGVVAPLLRRSQLLVTCAYALAAFALARRHLGLWFALFAALLPALSFRTVYLSELLFPELLFALVGVLFFLALGARSGRARAAAGPLAMAAYLLRTAGVCLLAVWVAEALAARRWKSAGVRALLALVPLVLWQAHVRRVESSADYRAPFYSYQRAPYLYGNVSYAQNLLLLDPFAPERGRVGVTTLLARTVENGRHVPTFVGELVFAPLAEWVWPARVLAGGLGVELEPAGFFLALLTLVGLATLAGLAWLARRGALAPPLFVLFSLGLIVSTPWQGQFWRYLAPLVPYFALGFAFLLAESGAAARRRWPGARWPAVALATVAGAALFVQVWTVRSMFADHRRELEWTSASGITLHGRAFYLEREWRAFEAALGWLRREARPGEAVACSVPALAWLGTGLPAVMPPFESDPGAALAALDSVPARYVILDELEFLDVTRRYMTPLLAARPESFEEVYRPFEWSTVSVWRRR